MELGEKLRLARQEAGLSQRQLCGDTITRNMLSQIEHGAARPSMDTLRILAHRLGKPVSWFLEEDVVVSPNQERMARAREAHRLGEIAAARQQLAAFQQPDETLEWEWRYLSGITALHAAQEAAADGKPLLARQLLEDAARFSAAFAGMERQRLLCLGLIPGTDTAAIVQQLPSLDEELMLRAEAALTKAEPERAAALLLSVENRESFRWNLLQGKTLLQKKQYVQAAECLQRAENVYPETLSLLEECYRELGDFRRAYQYACKQR